MQMRTPRKAPRPRRLARTTLLIAAAGTTAIAVLTGCSGGSDSASGGDKNVASLPTQGKSGSAAKPGGAADPDAGRPQIRLDSTEDDIKRMQAPYDACLEQHGAGQSLGKEIMKAHTITAAQMAAKEAAQKACQSKLPLQPPEFDPAKNPNYNDDTRAMVQCMNDKGIKSVADPEPPGWGLVNGDEMSLPGFKENEHACEMKAYGGKK